MKKRVAVILLVICILPATLAAATPFFQFGPLVSYNKTVVELDDENAWKDINNFSFGALTASASISRLASVHSSISSMSERQRNGR